MKRRKFLSCTFFVLLAVAAFSLANISRTAAIENKSGKGEIKLIVRGDDMGSCHTANIACIQCYRAGIMRSVEVMVPCPWFEEAAKMLNRNPGLDVGIHLTLTSEWENFKWRPLTHAPGIVDKDGYFYPQTREWNRWPAGTGFYDANPKLEEVEKELRAQIELALKKIRKVTHLSAHMGTATCRPDLKELVTKLAKEYGLHSGAEDLRKQDVKYAGNWGSSDDPLEKRESALIRLLEKLTPGTWMLVENPGLDTPEMKAMGHPGYENVAVHRDVVTKVFTNPKVKAVVNKRGIKLISYADLKAGF
jgi:predicted glycoside hydrolase/deacetylase ChbG (UPF0249 family)